MTREELEAEYGTVWDTDGLREAFAVKGFQAPYCVVERRSDSKVGSLMFQPNPRLYFNFVED